jgi:hypothetical protein
MVAQRSIAEPPDKTRRNLLIAAYVTILAGAFVLLFYGLDRHLLWGDEAETATLAKNVLRFGVPKTFDGVNRITLFGAGVDASVHDTWTWSPWLQEYLAAASFLVFGSTTWAARAPSAFFGWLALPLLAFTAYRIYRDHRISVAAVLVLGTSEVFLLHARQCRYYGPAVFLEILFILGIYQLQSGSRAGLWNTAIAMILLFYANYILAFANVPALIPLAWMLYRKDRRVALTVVYVGALFVAAATPWLLYASVARQSEFVGYNLFLKKETYYLKEFHFHFIPLIFLLLPLVNWLMSRRTAASQSKLGAPAGVTGFEWWLLWLMALYLGIILLPPGAFLRYLLPMLPVACLLAAAWVFRYVRRTEIAVALIAVQCLTNALALGSGFPFRGKHTLRWPLAEFVQGNREPFQDRFTDVLEYLLREAKPGESVFSLDPEFPLIFYTGLKVIDGRLIRDKTPLRIPPDWVLTQSASGVMNSVAAPPGNVVRLLYEEIVIPVHESVNFGVVPEPDRYQYHTGKERTFVLYRKKS